MAGTIFNLDDDVRAFLLRATASLERIDGAVADVQLLTRNASAAITELRQTVSAVRTGVAAFGLTVGKKEQS